MSGFEVSEALAGASDFACDWALCEVRLHRDGRFPWLLLLPRVRGAVELEDVPQHDRAVLMEEIARAGRAVRVVGEMVGRPVEKLNVAAIGNVVPQLHIHVVGRRRDDGLWPDPIWGRGQATVRSEAETRRLLEALRAA